jgi:hypothetical protein
MKDKKLKLNKATVAILNGRSMHRVVGGVNEQCQADDDCQDAVCIEGVCRFTGNFASLNGKCVTWGQKTCGFCCDLF